MGVPSYFSYLIRNHKEMLIKIFNFKKQINNLYFDSNSIIYDALRILSKDYDTYKKGSYHDYDVGGDNPPKWEKQPRNDMAGK